MKSTILVVHDAGRSAAEMAAIFPNKPYEIVIVDSAAEGLAALRSREIDILICDEKPNGMSGIAVLKIAKTIAPDCLRILLTTSESMALTAHAVSDIQIFRFLLKPCTPSDINSTILDALKARRDHDSFRAEEAQLLHPVVDEALNKEIDRALQMCRMVYQPVMSVLPASDAYGSDLVKSSFGYEALVRIDHPTLSNPLALIGAIRQAGRQMDMDRVVRGLVASDLSGAASTLDPDAVIFVNLLTTSLRDPELLNGTGPLRRFAQRIVFEVSENTPVVAVPDLPGVKAKLNSHGYRLGLDDLGGGPTGMRVFGLLRPDVVKFDNSLVRGINKSRSRAKTILAMIELCKTMNCLVLAEGVETKREYDSLLELGVELFQGYYIGRPSAGFTPVASAVDNQMSYGSAR